MEYSNGIRNGIFATFDQNGDTTEFSTSSNGKRYGYAYHRDTVTQFWSRGKYLLNQKTGMWTFNAGDSLIVCNYEAGKKNGAFRAEIYDNRVVQGYYKNDVRDSVWRISMYDQVMSECWYTNGKKYNTEKIFFPNSDFAYCQTTYRAPDDISMFAIYHSPGVPGKIEWYSKFIVDSIHLYHPSGKLQSRSIYKKCYDGKPVAHVANYVYDETGNLIIKTLSGPNGKDSLRYDYGVNENVIRTVNFKRGNIYATTYYYDNGNVRMRYVEDSIQVFAVDGKKLRMATPAYSKVFAQIDSIENSLPLIPVYSNPEAPEPPYSLSKINTLALKPPVLPSFPGGQDSLSAFIRRNMKYPRHELENGIEGKIELEFIVEADGSLTNIKAIYVRPDKNRAFQNEAIRLVKAMPKWIPGRSDYGPERVIWRLPILFSLD